VDFVIVGFGLGSLFLLLGIAARDLGPRLQAKPEPSTSLSADSSPRPAPQVDLWRRLTPLAGPTIMIGGAFIILATLAGIFLQLSDSEGSRLVLGAFLVAMVGLIVRLPFLARTRPKAAKPKIERRRPPTVQERPRPSRALQPNRAARPSSTLTERPQPVRKRPPPEPAASFQPRRTTERQEPPEQMSKAPIPDLPDIFGSDEPIQTGLLEKLLAEDDARTRRSAENQPTSDNGSSERDDVQHPSASERSVT
jgi:hypothetical protein